MIHNKKWPLIISLALISVMFSACSQNASIDPDASEQEQPIPAGMYFENNIKHINPDKGYAYWALIMVDRTSGKSVFKFGKYI